MPTNQRSKVPPGWVGGFAESTPAFAYPNPDLSSLPLLDNMDCLGKLQRQQAVCWPEFSWESTIGQADSRCYQMFAPDISRIGYTDEGRVYSIICPQQGVYFDETICLNIEVTVTGQRGWVNEATRELAADMRVVGKIWFSPSCHQHWLVRKLWDCFSREKLPFPSQKKHAIRVETHKVGSPTEPTFPVRRGESTGFKIPDFARHQKEAWGVGNVEVQIGPICKTGHDAVDTFNQKVLDLFNMQAGNILLLNNVLTWNVWFREPALVDRDEWRDHAATWRMSIDKGHGSPDGPGTAVRMFDGTPFSPTVSIVQELEDLLVIIKELL